MKPQLISFVSALALCLAATASAQTLFVVNQGNATASIINVQTGKQIATLEEGVQGVHAHEAAVTADGKRLFLPVYGSSGVGKPGVDGHEMLVFDVPSRKIVNRVDFGKGVRPHLPVMDDARHLLYVTTELNKSITVIDPSTGKILGAVPTGQEQSHMLAISSDGKRGYTANVGPGSVSVLDLVGRKTIAVVPVSGMVQRISITPDNKHVFTADQTKPQLAVIDTGTNKVSGYVALPDLGYGTAATPDGKWLLVAVPATNQVSVVDLNTMKVAKNLAVGKKPQEVLIDPSGKKAFVSCTTSGTVDEIDVASWNVKSIAAGPGADGLAWAK